MHVSMALFHHADLLDCSDLHVSDACVMTGKGAVPVLAEYLQGRKRRLKACRAKPTVSFRARGTVLAHIQALRDMGG